ncbi:pyruvate kinase [Plasticicumulans lactativorans]|uniref:Pyruvate kinase n=1 Tax=Plasticicumulans lactativorans TaxID=1133106 RepID=A0A4R2KQW1_9GAMM|nr:pyruvate kinase [Plasticicumulans lactativorans]TCO76024.1 pyruvate kinase [Plasticicumulans lactativorans]
MRRQRNAKIVATLGPASSTHETIRALVEAGADVFRFNFSHGSHADHQERLAIVRNVERELGRPIGVLLDLQGPKLRVGVFAEGKVVLEAGQGFRLDLDPTPGDTVRAPLPHPEIFAALEPGAMLLIDDGRVWLEVQSCGPDFAETRVTVGGPVSNRKGVNVPSVVLPISPLTEKDRRDLAFGLDMGVDWVALSFVQRPEDIDELRGLVGNRAAVLAKLEKPAAIDALEAIVERCDGIMVARGDLGVEVPPERVPLLQKRIIHVCRRLGRPVIVATHMLDSMVAAPVPTRAEASDVANAIYDGADAVMLSAESASGQYPIEAVRMMDRIVREVEHDPHYRSIIETGHPQADATLADAVCCALRRVTHVLGAAATVTYTSSGYTTLRAARERPEAPILCLTPNIGTARRLTLAWGVHPVHGEDIHDVAEMVEHAKSAATEAGFVKTGDALAIVAGIPFAHPGTTNLLHVTRID